jgi:hypothetical protein
MRRPTKKKLLNAQLETFVLKKKHTRLLREIYEDKNIPKAKKIIELRRRDEMLHFYVRNLFTVIHKKQKTVREIVFNLCYRKIKGVCKTCGSQTKFEVNCSWSYAPYCSRTCCNSNEETKAKKVQSSLERYGCENISQAKSIKKKKVKTWLKTLGVEYPQQSKKVQSKTKKNFLKKWGVENPSQVKEIQQRKIDTSWEKYGTKEPNQSKIIKQQIVNSNLLKYGVRHPMHVPEIFERTMRAAHRVKKFKTQGKSFNYMGYEKYYIKQLIRKGILAVNISTKACDMPEIYYKMDGKIKKYTPDIIYTNKKGKQIVVEVKSTWTGGLIKQNRRTFYELKKKSQAASKVCNYKVVFINKQGTKRVVLKNLHEMNLRTVKALVLPLLKNNVTN